MLESNVNFILARWSFKNWKKLIQLLAYTEYKEVFQALLSRTLLLIAYYELKEIESLSHYSVVSNYTLTGGKNAE